MTSVVDLNRERRDRRLIWVCACGCTSFYLAADGGAFCQSCGCDVTDGPAQQWRAKLPPAPEPEAAEELGGDTFKVTNLDSAETWFKRRLREDTKTVLGAAAIYTDGSLSSFAMPDLWDTPERIEWTERRLADLRTRFIRR